MNPINNTDDNPVFDAAYWAHQPSPVQALRTAVNDAQRSAQAITLAQQGYIIDVPIMVWGWDPWKVMRLRQMYGYTWVPSALQPPIAVAPGLNFPGLPSYDPNNPPAGSIRVSTDVADYPPLDLPTPPSPTVTPDYIGVLNFSNIYTVLAGDPAPDGATVSDSRGKFVKHKVISPFGYSQWYEKVS